LGVFGCEFVTMVWCYGEIYLNWLNRVVLSLYFVFVLFYTRPSWNGHAVFRF
jgi:hypothetical protein